MPSVNPRVFPTFPIQIDRQHPLSAGLVGWWPLAGNGRDLLDRNHATMVGTKATTSHGGPAMAFTGASGTYCSLPTFPVVTTTFSISAWAYPTSLSFGSMGGGSGGTIMESNHDGATSGWCFGLENSTNKIWFWPQGSADARSNGTITLGRWNHVGLTVTGTTVKLYINGNLDTSVTTGGPPQSSTFMNIGSQNHCTGFFDGMLRDIRMFNRVLTPSEMSRLYLEPFCNLLPNTKRLMPSRRPVLRHKAPDDHQ